jgi:hypothetical protein
MSTGSTATPADRAPHLPLSWQRLLALSGVALAVLFIIGWVASGGDAPDYGASEQAWTDWADDNQWKSRVGGFAMLLAGSCSCTAGMIRSVLGRAESSVGGSAELARTAFGGAVTGMTGMAMTIVIIASSDSEGANANPVITRAVASASAGPFLVSAMAFAAFLGAAGLLTLRTGVKNGGARKPRADDGTRTHDTWLGKPVLYQLSYVREAPILLAFDATSAPTPGTGYGPASGPADLLAPTVDPTRA